ncbi:hypothetical protein AYL99_00053 [Fonsecaea erecta]|uniref:DUF6590 domain-containing protein n=1 Tax=Fonsecaea erecta TaxID=1367422 RepID=A0A178ZXC6_9EURO|nr:hypothetical protein AYL99_00053 [Fonsecaea erecta]OAP64081.1 hypothetical protein AYL99_00053 [Fonsecaea erecta]
MPEQPKSLPFRDDRRSIGRAAGRNNDDSRIDRQIPAQRRSDAPRSTPRIATQAAQPGYAATNQRQPPSTATNPVFPQERITQSYQIAPGEQPSSRVTLSTTPGTLGFDSSLELPLQTFANIPRGDFVNVVKHLRTNSSVLRQDAQPLLGEASHAYQSMSRGTKVQSNGRRMYGDSCVQQYVILTQLHQRLQKLVEAQHSKKVTARELAEVTNRYLDQLLDEASPARKQLVEEFDKMSAHVQRQVHSTPATSPQQTQTQMRTNNQAQQSVLPFQNSSEISHPSLGALNLPSPSGGDIGQQGLTTEISRGENKPRLDSSFCLRTSAFYEPGRVFAVLWHEPYSNIPGKAGNESRNTYVSDNVSYSNRFAEGIYSSIRRMVVVRQDHGCSICIQINSYGQRGLAKFKGSPRDIEAHSIIHMEDTLPQQQPSEPTTNKRPIAVKKTSPGNRGLNEWSRLCYSQPRTVQHTVKAQDIGLVTKECLPYLKQYFQQANALPPGN